MEFAHKSSHLKKAAIEKNSTVSNREFDSLSDTVEFFDCGFFLRVKFCEKNDAREVIQGHSISTVPMRSKKSLLLETFSFR